MQNLKIESILKRCIFAGLRGTLDRSHSKLSRESKERIQPEHEGGISKYLYSYLNIFYILIYLKDFNQILTDVSER